MDNGGSSGVIETFIRRSYSAFVCLICLGCFAAPDIPVFPMSDVGNPIESDAQPEDTSVQDIGGSITDFRLVDGVNSDLGAGTDMAYTANDAMPQNADAMPQNTDAMPQNTDAVIPIDAVVEPDEPSDAGCTPSDEVCDGLDNNCSGEIDDDNACRCERDMDPLFYICMAAVDWQTARVACSAAGDGLAVIETAVQNLLALALIGESPAPPSAWIGLNDIETEDTFVWYDMNPAQYRSWRFDMPDNSGEEDCVELQPGGWNDLSCDAPRPFICRDTGQN